MGERLFSLVMPFYRQSDHMLAVVKQYEAALSNFPARYEMILVVNGMSEAESRRLPWEELRAHPAVNVVVSEKAGWGWAVKQGLQAAQGDTLCFLNSARTSPQDLLLFLLYGLANPAVVLKANRKIRDSRLRRIGSLLYNMECRILFDLSCWDINGTPKIFPRQFARLLSLKHDNDLLDLEFNVICRRENYPMLEIPTFSAKRHGGVSTTNWRSAIRMYIGAYRFWRQEKYVKGK